MPRMMTLNDFTEFIAKVRYGAYEEFELVRFINRELLTPQQLDWLYIESISVEDLLNGRFNGDLEPQIKTIFADWNAKCETELFKL